MEAAPVTAGHRALEGSRCTHYGAEMLRKHGLNRVDSVAISIFNLSQACLACIGRLDPQEK